MSNPVIAIAGKIKVDSFNTIHEISLPFLLLRALGFVPVVEGAMSNIHKLASPSDTATASSNGKVRLTRCCIGGRAGLGGSLNFVVLQLHLP
jgi:mannitol-specific phosphotransferase system IIBC component